jgi:hypothetical protein
MAEIHRKIGDETATANASSGAETDWQAVGMLQ